MVPGPEGTSSGCNSSGPISPDIKISYNFSSHSKAKFYFKTNVSVSIEKIIVLRNSETVLELNFDFPYLSCRLGETKLINEFTLVYTGDVWKFSFSGINHSYGDKFSDVESQIEIQ